MSRVLRILIVDDSPDDRAEIRRLLLAVSSQHHEFSEAETGAAAVQLCRTNSPDCLVLDYSLPDLTAPEVLAQLATLEPTSMVPVVVLTESSDPAIGREVLRAGAQDFLGKAGMTPDILARAIANAVERGRMAMELRNREAALRASEERLEVALRATAVIGFTWDVQNDQVIRFHSTEPVLPVNPNAPERVADVRAVVHSDDRDAFDAAVAACLAHGQTYRAEYRVVRPDGSVRWLAEEGTLSRDASGRPVRLTGVSRDITERKHAELALGRLAAIVTSSTDAILSADLDGTVTTWNNGAERLFGFSAAEMVGQSIARLSPEDQKPREGDILNRLARGDAIEPYDTVRIRNDGQRVEVSVLSSPILNGSGAVIGVSTVVRDITVRVEAARSLHASEQRLRLAIEGADLGTWDVDLNTEIATWNARHAASMGYAHAGMHSMADWQTVVHPDDLAPVLTAIDRAKRTGDIFAMEHRIRRADSGEERRLALYGRFTYDAAGAAVRFSGTSRDVTEDRRAAEAERNRLLTLLAQVPAVVNFLRGPDFVFEFAHPLAVKALGGRQMFGRKLLDAMPEHRGQPFYGHLKRVFETGEPFSQREAEARLNIDGQQTVTYWNSQYLAVRDAAGQIEGVMTYDVDVTDQVNARKQVEQAGVEAEQQRAKLAESRARADYAVRLSGIGFWYCDLPFDELAWDARAKEHFFLPPNARVTIDIFYERIVADDRALTRAAIDKSIKNRSIYDLVFRTHDPETDAIKWIRAMGGTSYAADGTPIRFDGVTVDISKQKRDEVALDEARAEAEKANHAKDEFLAMLGHELRNPLAPIATAVQLLRMRGGSNVAREIDVIERQSQHIAHLVDDLLDVSRIVSGKVILHKHVLETAELIAAAIETASPAIEHGRHELVLTVPKHDLAVDVDRERITQVFSNLLTNAAKYTPAGGRITVTASRRADSVVIDVEDSGTGLSPELLPRVFDLFVQSRQTLDRAKGGLGLGLAIVKNLVVMHGGTVSAHSAGPGRGSRFTVRLPAAPEAGPRMDRAAPLSTAAVPHRYRVLIVDDNADGAEMLAAALGNLGYLTATANDGPEALQIASQFLPHAALLDIGLPVMDGYELASRLRDQGNDVPLVAITGYGQDGDRARTHQAGFQAHLTKPVNLELLTTLLGKLVTGETIPAQTR